MSNDATNGYAEVNGLRMYYERHGYGPPLVLLHGAFGTIESCVAVLLPEPEGILERRVPRRASGRLAKRIRAP
jgi:pimeloyl-ACP methyl ester carboxylesterase